jgi:hypothetical protein
MLKYIFCQILISIAFIPMLSLSGAAQSFGSVPYRSQEVAEGDNVPVLIKHLPAWQEKRANATFSTSIGQVRYVLGDRPVLNAIEFVPGTEAVTGQYESGQLLIIEFASPQAASEAASNIEKTLSESGDTTTVHRRIGNYNALVFDVSSEAAANSLLDEVKYEKQIHWLGNNPFRISAERAFVLTTSDIFLSTVLFILIGVGLAIVGGLATGILYFRLREGRRAAMTAHTDAGGMTRLNLDGLTPDIMPGRLLKD